MAYKTYGAFWGIRRWPSNSERGSVIDVLCITISICVWVLNIIDGSVMIVDLFVFRINLHRVITVIIEVKSVGIERHGVDAVMDSGGRGCGWG
jgi:hypothetical protein